MTKFLDFAGLATFLDQLKERLATTAEVTQVEDDTNTYVTNIDYSELEFDKKEIVFDGSESPLLNTGELNMMFLQ